MKTFKKWLAGLLVVGILPIALVYAAEITESKASSDPALSPRQVLSKIHHANKMEIAAGEMASERAQSPSVKEFGNTLKKDHSDADSQVQELASKEGVTLVEPKPQGIMEKMDMQKEQKTMQDLRSESSATFDKKFVKAMINDHQSTISDLQKIQNKLPESSSVRQLIAKLLPKLEQHEQMAKDLEKQIS